MSAVTVVVSVGCKSSSQTPGDGGPADTADDHLRRPEINLGSDAADAARCARRRRRAARVHGPEVSGRARHRFGPGLLRRRRRHLRLLGQFRRLGLSIMRVPGAGGTPEYFECSDFLVGDMAIKDGFLYWAASDGIYRRDLAAARGSATKIASDSPNVRPVRRGRQLRLLGRRPAARSTRRRPPAARPSIGRRAPRRSTSPPTVRTFTGRTSRICRAVRS